MPLELIVVHFEQLSGAARTRKLVEILLCHFQAFLLILHKNPPKIDEKDKKGEKLTKRQN